MQLLDGTPPAIYAQRQARLNRAGKSESDIRPCSNTMLILFLIMAPCIGWAVPLMVLPLVVANIANVVFLLFAVACLHATKAVAKDVFWHHLAMALLSIPVGLSTFALLVVNSYGLLESVAFVCMGAVALVQGLRSTHLVLNHEAH